MEVKGKYAKGDRVRLIDTGTPHGEKGRTYTVERMFRDDYAEAPDMVELQEIPGFGFYPEAMVPVSVEIDDYNPLTALEKEVNRFLATNQFTPMQVTNFYIQARVVINDFKRMEKELERLRSQNDARYLETERQRAEIIKLGDIIDDVDRIVKKPITVAAPDLVLAEYQATMSKLLAIVEE